MIFKKIIAQWKKENQVRGLQERLIRLEEQVNCLHKLIGQEHPGEIQKKEEQQNQLIPPIIVEKLNVEKIVVDKLEFQNNFGALGIKDLKGKLNIGANYGVGTPYSNWFNKENIKGMDDPSTSEKSENQESVGPTYTIKGKDL